MRVDLKDKRVRLAITGVVALVVLAAGGWLLLPKAKRFYEQLTQEAPPSDSEGDGESASDTAAGGEPAVTLTMADLSPSIQLVGEDGVVPRSIRFVLARPVTTTTSSAPPSGTVVRFEPAVAGSMMYESPTTFVFLPNKPFAYGTKYTVALDSVDVMGKVISQKDSAKREFSTPNFDLKRVGLARARTDRNEYEFQVVFTGPVDLEGLKSRATFKSEAPIKGISWRIGNAANEYIATVGAGPKLAEGGRVTFYLKPGLKSQQGATIAGDRSIDVEIFAGAALDIKQVKLTEGANGFYLEVLCNDGARNANPESNYENRIYYYDRQTYDGMYLSDRCVPDEQTIAGRIRFSPDVKFTMAPSRGGFRLLGELAAGELTLTIEAGVQTIDGAILKVPHTQSFSVPHRKPSVGFGVQGRYLPRAAWSKLPIKHLNIDKAELTARVIPPENLAFWMSADQETADDRNSNVILKKELDFSGKSDVSATDWIDVQALVHETPHGVVEFTITDLPARKAVERRRLVMTNINLVVKRAKSGKEIRAWALGIEDAKALSGVNIKLVVKSGRTLAECMTGGDGGCDLTWDATKEVDPAPPFALIAAKDGDLTYLKFDELKTEISEQLVQGRPFSGGQTPYRAAIYSDRGAYRPGELAHIAAVVRGENDEAPKTGMPVELQLLDPRDKPVRKLTLKTNTAGLVTTDLRFETFANTGKYTVTMAVAGAEVGRYDFNVEEFVPERMKVEPTSVKPELMVGERGEVNVSAVYLFGGSAGGSRAELVCQLWPSEFKPKENANYQFGVWYADAKTPKPIDLGSVSGQLDEDGKATLACPEAEQVAGFVGPAKLIARAVVFEGESGRSTQSETSVPVHPDKLYVGLSAASGKVKKGDTVNVQGVVVDWAGKAVKGAQSVEVEFVRLDAEYDWSWDEDSGSSYKRYLRQSPEGRATVDVKNGKFETTFKASESGSGFLVRARLGNARTDLELAGDEKEDYWWSPSETARDQTPRPFKPSWVDVEAPEVVAHDDDVEVKFAMPFKGRVLITAETDELVATEWRDVGAGEQVFSFKLKKFYPNVYVSVFAVKDPKLESASSFMPDRAFGVRSLRVDPKPYAHALKITTPGEIKPNSTLTVDVDLGKGAAEDAFVTVAAVDEGILSLTRFKTPDPLKLLFAPRALGVETFETIGWNVMLPGSGPASTTGGDGAEGEAPVQLVKPVALWSGPVAVEDGKASISLEVPQYRGALRVMVVSVDGQRVGQAAATVTVRDPLVLQTTLPRFLTDGDLFNVPVSVTNMSGKEQNVSVSLKTTAIDLGEGMPENPIAIEGTGTVKIPLAVGQSQTVVFRAAVKAPIGGVAFAVEAEGDGVESREDLEVPIKSAKARARIVKRLDLSAGELDLKAELAGWLPTTEKSTFWVTANPYADALGHLKHLVHYPYGCIEQTTSSTRPLLVIRDILPELDPALFNNASSIDDMVKKGIDRILSMQTPSGGFAYWPGSEHPTQWGTAYATHMLIDAQKLKYPVPKERIDDAVSYLTSQITNTFRYASDDDYQYSDLRDAVPYIHYVLALAGKPLKADIDKALDKLIAKDTSKKQRWYDSEGAKAEGVMLLKAALYLAGDRRYEGDLRHPDVSAITADRENSWYFYSDLRRRGMTLSVFTDLFGGDKDGDKLAAAVAERLRLHRSDYYTTQELVWAVTGLGKYVQGGTKDFGAELLVNGKAVKSSGKASTWTVARASEKDVKLSVDKQGEGKLFLILGSEGIPTTGEAKIGGDGLKLSRRYLRPDGSTLDPSSDVKLGDVVFAAIEISNTSGDPIENIALVDRLPAGWEIENPRLGRGTTASFIDGNEIWAAQYMNIRDDRLEVFGPLKANETRSIFYAARAVVSGNFTIPPLEAEAMYDPRIWARQPGGKTNIQGPWKEFAAQ
jgi:uncharacterized repeat protein (TIGR01451 family)